MSPLLDVKQFLASKLISFRHSVEFLFCLLSEPSPSSSPPPLPHSKNECTSVKFTREQKLMQENI